MPPAEPTAGARLPSGHRCDHGGDPLKEAAKEHEELAVSLTAWKGTFDMIGK